MAIWILETAFWELTNSPLINCVFDIFLRPPYEPSYSFNSSLTAFTICPFEQTYSPLSLNFTVDERHTPQVTIPCSIMNLFFMVFLVNCTPQLLGLPYQGIM